MSRDDEKEKYGALPDDPITPGEREHAASFASRIDDVIGGRELPPAMASDERMLVEMAAMVRASTREVALSDSRRDKLIADALSQVLPGRLKSVAPAAEAAAPQQQRESAAKPVPGDARHERGETAQPAQPKPSGDNDRNHDMDELGAYRRRRLSRILPWSIATMASAAALALLLLRSPAPTGPKVAISDPEPAALGEIHRSRPADALIGQIARTDADRASDRIDVIFADRMTGYRELQLRGEIR